MYGDRYRMYQLCKCEQKTQPQNEYMKEKLKNKLIYGHNVLTRILQQITKVTGIMQDCRFSRATTPRNQHTENAGWKNNENLTARLNSAQSCESLELCNDRSAMDNAPKSNLESQKSTRFKSPSHTCVAKVKNTFWVRKMNTVANYAALLPYQFRHNISPLAKVHCLIYCLHFALH